MPIKPENLARYPRDWKLIRARILERARHRCEFCEVPDRAWRNNVIDTFTIDTSIAELWHRLGESVTRIVLTIAHLDHTPENCADDNLRALCQRCHNRYDRPHRNKNAAATRREKKCNGNLLEHVTDD